MFTIVSFICSVVSMLLLLKCSYIPRKVFVVDKYSVFSTEIFILPVYNSHFSLLDFILLISSLIVL